MKVNCDQCEALMINRVFCHETGCPNTFKEWNPEEEAWIFPLPDDDYGDCEGDDGF